MRYLLLLAALWMLVHPVRAASVPADTAAVRLERLPAEGLLLTKGWRYHVGDDPAWARPDFDDSRWDTLNLSRPRRALPASLHTGMSWLRLRFQLGDSLRRRALLLQVTCIGAGEIYLDGELLGREGTVNPDPALVWCSPTPTLPRRWSYPAPVARHTYWPFALRPRSYPSFYETLANSLCCTCS